MSNKWIVFYVSSHGFGHMTRCLAIIDEILENTDYQIYIASGKPQNDFARIYLDRYENRIEFNDITTDIGLKNIHSRLKVDRKELERELLNFVENWDYSINEEYRHLRGLNIKCVISDISPIGSIVGRKLGVKNVGISNFTWVEQYKELGINSNIIESFKSAYSKLDYLIEYELALPMNDVIKSKHKMGFVSRKIDYNKVDEIKKKYGKSIFITCGKSANLDNICVKHYSGCIFTTSGIDVLGSGNVVKLPTHTLDTQNYIAASSMVISKAGWSTISETIVARRRLVLIEREDVIEDTFNITELKNRSLAISIKESDLSNIDMTLMEKKANKNISQEKLNMYSNQNTGLLKILGL